jgi:hypothetical protein
MLAAVRIPRTWCFFLGLLLALFVSSATPCLAQPEDDDDLPAVAIPDSKVGKELTWVLSVVNGRSLGDPAEKFTERFLEIVPPDDLKTILSSVREKSFGGAKVIPVKVMSNDERADTINAVIRGEGTKRYLAVFLILDGKTGKIAGLRFAPAGGMGGMQQGGDIKGLERDLKDMPMSEEALASLGAYELIPKDEKDPKQGFKLRPIYEFGEERRLAIGSTFKLYVLGALAEQIAKGEAKWDEKLAIKDELKALPSGVMHLAAAGTEYPLSEFADKMISISDNTAAGHLLNKVGRGKVEDYFSNFNGDPARSLPFLSPREMFIIKLNKDASLADRYAAADQDTRRVMIAGGGEVAKGGLDMSRVPEWKTPLHIQDIEWFATATECCRVMADLHRLELQPGMEPLGKALRINPGMPFDKDMWKSVAFKGGSEPGVENLTWLLERADGHWYTLSVTWNDKEKALDEPKLLELAGKGVAILANDGKKQPVQAAAAEKPKEKKAQAPRELNDGN